MGWTEIHDAVQAMIVQATGLPADKVIWKYQNTDAPLQNYVAARFSTIRSKGQDYVTTDYDAMRPTGQEIRITARGTREVVLEIECFTTSTADSQDAMSLGELIKSSLILPQAQEILDAVELSPFDPGEVNYIPDVPSTTFRGRATLSIRCYVPATLARQFTTYISTISGTLTAKGGGTGSDIVYPYTLPE